MQEEDKKIYLEIDRILWEMWDPVGVNDNEDFRDEYQSYVPHIFTLAKQRNLEALADYLYKTETALMGMDARNTKALLKRCFDIAQIIMNI
jgi:hypothetical protein